MDKIGKGVFWLVLAGALVFGFIGVSESCDKGQLKNDILKKDQEIKAGKIVMAESAEKIRSLAEELKSSNADILARDKDIETAGKVAVKANIIAKNSTNKVEKLINEGKDWKGLKKEWKKDRKIQADNYNKLMLERNELFDQNKQWKLWSVRVFLFVDETLKYLELSERIVADFETQLKNMLKLHNKRLLFGLTIGPGVHGEGFEYLMMNLGLTLRVGKKFELPDSYQKLSKLTKLRKNIENNKLGG